MISYSTIFAVLATLAAAAPAPEASAPALLDNGPIRIGLTHVASSGSPSLAKRKPSEDGAGQLYVKPLDLGLTLVSLEWDFNSNWP